MKKSYNINNKIKFPNTIKLDKALKRIYHLNKYIIILKINLIYKKTKIRFKIIKQIKIINNSIYDKINKILKILFNNKKLTFK
jgi:hypothetical protein